MANRHGLIAGATGTGKTVTLKVIAESFSDLGVPMFIADIKGDQKEIGWGSQIRSYVFMPYTLAKDHRTGYEMGNINAVMDGDLDGFINAYLKKQSLDALANG